MNSQPVTIVALSGGVDSAVAALLLREQGHRVECLHMTNWEDDDGYCSAAADLQDARAVCDRLGLPLHRVNFAEDYRDKVFAAFLADIQAGRTPNPDVLCNREIKFGVMRRFARRLGGDTLATGHYARLGKLDHEVHLLKGADPAKDQSYFLAAVASSDFSGVEFPLGELDKSEVRQLASDAGLSVSGKRDSTGICFIGERPFNEFIDGFVPARRGAIVTDSGKQVGEHEGLHHYTLGQRKGIGVGGLASSGDEPWYVAAKDGASNTLTVVQGHDHPALFCAGIDVGQMHWIGAPPVEWASGGTLRCQVKTRYRQADQACSVERTADTAARIVFDSPQRAVTPGQYAVLYTGDRCLGSAVIDRIVSGPCTVIEAEAG